VSSVIGSWLSPASSILSSLFQKPPNSPPG
jgi:hypothetical protein